MSLTDYQRKRDFKRTPEPKGKDPKATAARRYVVHRHHATRLHWDVRLEMRGVLASFAVPQGPPLEAGNDASRSTPRTIRSSTSRSTA